MALAHHGLRGPRGNLYQRLHRTNFERPSFTDDISKILYVIRMGFHRWGRAARRRWVMNLIVECNATANRCREWLAEDYRTNGPLPPRSAP